jgi:transcriptional regulator with XRE-family HTH domain
MKRPTTERSKATKAIKEARRRVGLTQRNVADKAGVDPATVHRVERGHGGLDARLRIGQALGLSPDALFGKRSA